MKEVLVSNCVNKQREVTLSSHGITPLKVTVCAWMYFWIFNVTESAGFFLHSTDLDGKHANDALMETHRETQL